MLNITYVAVFIMDKKAFLVQEFSLNHIKDEQEKLDVGLYMLKLKLKDYVFKTNSGGCIELFKSMYKKNILTLESIDFQSYLVYDYKTKNKTNTKDK